MLAGSVRHHPHWLPAAAGVAVAGTVAWLACPAAYLGSETLPVVSGVAVGYIALASLAGILVSAGLAAMLGQRLIEWRAAVAIFWLPALVLLLVDDSLWVCVAAVAVGWFAARPVFGAAAAGPRVENPELFRTIHAMDAIPRVPSIEALSSAVSLQSGGLTAALGRIGISAACWGIGAALGGRLAAKQRLDADAGRSPGPVRALAPLALALLLTMVGMLPFLRSGVDGPAGSARADNRTKSQQESDDQGGIFKGVILLTPEQPHTVLVPPLPFLPNNLFRSKRSDPLSVPFYGVYWMFRPPNRQPPAGSFVTHGTPLDAVYRSTGRLQLVMEAHQNFGKLFDVSCCSKIQLGIRSADRATAIELVLRNTTGTPGAAMSLGEFEVPSTEDVRPDRSDPAVPMLINFDMPRHPKIRQFDEATIIFNRRYATASAKVAIDRFVFVPRRF